MEKIILSSDTSCDIPPELKEKYQVQLYSFRVFLDEVEYQDGVDLTPQIIFNNYAANKTLPRTAASSPLDYEEYFRSLLLHGDAVIHISIGSGISSAFQSATLAAKEIGDSVYVIDSASLSSGLTCLLCEAGEQIAQGATASQIAQRLLEDRNNLQVSFVIDTLTFLHAGGRCSALAAFGGNLLGLKPCIEVDNQKGAAMTTSKKYRGNSTKVLSSYIDDRIARFPNARKDKVFITYSSIEDGLLEQLVTQVKEYGFESVYCSTAGATITTHCGPGTLGIIFMTT